MAMTSITTFGSNGLFFFPSPPPWTRNRTLSNTYDITTCVSIMATKDLFYTDVAQKHGPEEKKYPR